MNKYHLTDKELEATYFMLACNEFYQIYGRKVNMLSKDDVISVLNLVENYKKKGM